MKTITRNTALLLLLIATLLGACSKNDYRIFNGELNRQLVERQPGFPDTKATVLKNLDMSDGEFISLTTVDAANLSDDKKTRLKALRNELPAPTTRTLMQKVIPIQSLPDYMDNVYGTIGGFVSISGDMKQIKTMHDIFWGLRLDYAGTKFKENGAGYAVIRFYPTSVDRIVIPYCPAMGGTTTGEWPFGGGGFTTSTLGSGGYPEYKYDGGYYAPQEGAEIYECTPQGNEILRSTFDGTRWNTFEGSVITKSDVVPVAARQIQYRGYTLWLRGETAEGRHLFTSDPRVANALGMERYDRDEYRLIVKE